MTETPKPRKRKPNPKAETVNEVTDIKTETVGQSKSEEYINSEPQQYKPPEKMVALNDDRYLKKDRVGKNKAVRGPGVAVTKVGLGGLRTVTQNPIDYHGNLDVQSE